MKNVEPFIKFDNVLNYETPPPPKPPIETMRDFCDEAMDSVGGPVVACFIAAVACMTIGLSIHGMLGSIFVVVSGLLLRLSMNYWQNSSRW